MTREQEQGQTFGATLRRWRLLRGLTQEDLAERAGLSVRTLRYLERGGHVPYRDTVSRLADALGVETRERATFLAAVPAAVWEIGPALQAEEAWRPPPRNPYKGLRAFTAADAGDFFGCEGFVTALLNRLSTLGDGGPRLLALIGPSGAGKSSVVLAGLLPRLQAGALPGSAAWHYLPPLVPGIHPLEALTVVLGHALPSLPLTAIRADLATSCRGLHQLAGRLVSDASQRVVLVVDQCEELYTLTRDATERQRFIDLLVGAATEPHGPLLVLLTLRADYYDRPLADPALGPLLDAQGMAVLPLTTAELRAAIAGPAALPDVGVCLEDGLVEEVLDALRGQVGTLPLLQFTLEALFVQRDGRRLTRAALQEIGGVRGALACQAEATYAALPDTDHRQLARALFLRLLEPGATEREATRRRATLTELTLADPAATARLRVVADRFVAARLLVAGEQAGTPTLEVGHEALIGAWDRLAGWVRTARDDIRLQHTLAADAAAWEQRGQPPDRLYRGTQLAEAQAWAARNRPSAQEAAFLAASVAEQDHRAQAERTRQEEQLRLAQQAAAAERRAAQRLRGLVGVLAGSLLVALALGASAWAARSAALTNARAAAAARAAALVERDRALSRQLAAEGQAALGTQPDRGLLLGVEAERRADTPEARRLVLQGLQAFPRLRAALRGAPGELESVAFSPDGATLAAAGDDGIIRLWDVARQRVRGPPLRGHTDAVSSVAFSPNGRLLASGGADGAVRLWEVGRRRPLGPPLVGHGAVVLVVAFSPDGRLLAAGGDAGLIRLWDVAQRPIQPWGPPLDGRAGEVNALAFGPDGRLLAVGGGDGTIRLWDVARHRPLAPPLRGHATAVTAVAVSPSGALLLSGSTDGTVRIWDLRRRRPRGRPLMRGDSAIYSVALGRNGHSATIAAGGADGTVRLWDAASGRPLGAPLNGQTGAVRSVAFSPDGQTLAADGADGAVLLWDVATPHPVPLERSATASSAFSLALRPDGALLASGGDPAAGYRLWRVTHGQLRPVGPPLPSGGLWAVGPTFSRGGTVLAAGGYSGAAGIPLWNLRHLPARPAGLLRLPDRPQALVRSVLAFDPRWALLARGRLDGRVEFWDGTRSPPRLRGPPARVHPAPVSALALSHDGRLLASAGMDLTVRLWVLTQDRQGVRPRGGPLAASVDTLSALAFSPDDRLLAVGDDDGTIRLIDTTRGVLRGPPLLGHGLGMVAVAVAFSPDGRILASGGGDGMIRLWDVATGQPIGVLRGHAPAVLDVVFSPDGATLFSTGWDATIRLWDLDVRSWLRRACVLAGRNLSRQEWAQYLGDAPYYPTCSAVLAPHGGA